MAQGNGRRATTRSPEEALRQVARFGKSRADLRSPPDGKALTRRQRRQLWILAVLIWIGASGLIVYVAAKGYFGAADIPDLGPGFPDGGSLIDFRSWLLWGSVATAIGVTLYVLGARYVLFKARRRGRRAGG